MYQLQLARVGSLRATRWLVPIVAVLAFSLICMEQASLISLDVRTSRVVSLWRSDAYFCPSPPAPRPSTPFAPGDLSEFHPLRSQLGEFTLAVAHAPLACNQFRVRIERTDRTVCHRARDQKVSEDQLLQEHITRSLGPDTFQLRIDGAERLAVDTPSHFDSETCTYEFDVRLSTPGTVWLNPVRLFKDYDGFFDLHVNESLHLNPAIQSLLPRAVQLNICSSACPLYVAPLPNTDSIVYDPFHAGDPVPEQMLACTGPDPIPGVYVATNLHSVLHPPVALPMSETRPSAGLYTFVPTGCTFQHDGLRFRNHGSCLEMKERVLFIGDSHARAAYDALLHRLGGNDTVVQVSEKIQTKSGDLNNLHMDFIWDPFASNKIDCNLMRNVTAVVLSTGSHQAAWHCQTTPTAALEAQLSTLFSSWAALGTKCLPPGAPTPKLVYLNSPAFAYSFGHYRLDCRTNPRLEYWNTIADRLARRSGWSVVDTFAHSKAFAIDTLMLDGIHYLGTDAIDPIADELIEKLRICGDPHRNRK